MTKEQVDAFIKRMRDERASAVTPIVEPIAERLRKLGVPMMTDVVAPMIETELAPALILQVEQWKEVDRIYLRQTPQLLARASVLQNAPLALAQARSTINADVVQARGITGTNVKAAVIEPNGIATTDNPYLTVIQDPDDQCTDPLLSFPHITQVAGVIRSTHPTQRGIAPDVTLRTGGGCSDSSLARQTYYALNWEARVFNFSYGSASNRVANGEARFIDELVAYNGITAVVAAGNNGAAGCPNYESSSGDVWSPGTAYNSITVGSFDDKGTTAWVDDVMDSCSSWRNPISTHGDRDKPEIVAPGENITTAHYRETDTDPKYASRQPAPWLVTQSGTSLATPMVSGVVALMMQRDPVLQTLPTAVKSILAVAAVHDIDSEVECTGNGEGQTCGTLGKYDGAGGIVADRADDVVRGINGNWGVYYGVCEAPMPFTLGTMSLTAGVRTRVAVTWNTDTNYLGYEDQPSADFDLTVVDDQVPPEDYRDVAVSLSWDNNIEFVEFTPSTSGSYSLTTNSYRCERDPGLIGWAWYQGN